MRNDGAVRLSRREFLKAAGLLAGAGVSAGCGRGPVVPGGTRKPSSAGVPDQLPSPGEFGTPVQPRWAVETGQKFGGIGSGGIDVPAEMAVQGVREAEAFQRERAGQVLDGVETETLWDVQTIGGISRIVVLYSVGAAGAQVGGLPAEGRVLAGSYRNAQNQWVTAEFPFDDPESRQKFEEDRVVLQFDGEEGKFVLAGSDERGARKVLATFARGGWEYER